MRLSSTAAGSEERSGRIRGQGEGLGTTVSLLLVPGKLESFAKKAPKNFFFFFKPNSLLFYFSKQVKIILTIFSF